MDKIRKEDMKEVQGGTVTRMCCSKCGYAATWDGFYYYPFDAYECPSCHQQSLKGVSISGGGEIIF